MMRSATIAFPIETKGNGGDNVDFEREACLDRYGVRDACRLFAAQAADARKIDVILPLTGGAAL